MTEKKSMIRMNFTDDAESGINNLISLYMNAHYAYKSKSYYYGRGDVALTGFAKHFNEHMEDRKKDQEKLMDYQNKRGGKIHLKEVQKPEKDMWGSGLDGMECALNMEKIVMQSILDLHKKAEDSHDADLSDFLESNFLRKQTELLRNINHRIHELRRAGPGLGEYMFDHHLRKGSL